MSLALAAPPGLRCGVVQHPDELFRLEPEWRALLGRSRVDHPFLSHDWVSSFWDAFARDRALRVVTVRAGSALVGLAPLMLSRERVGGLRLRLLASLGNAHTPRYEFVAERGLEGPVHAAIWQAIVERRSEWDGLRLAPLPAGSTTLGELARLAADDGFLVGLWLGDVSPRLALVGRVGDYLATLRRKHRSNLRNRARRLEELGPTRYETIRAGDFAGALEEGFALEASGWKDRTGTAIRRQPEARAFYTSLAARAARRGWLRLDFLSVGGRRIAFDYSLCYGRRFYLLKTGYDPAFARFSPYNLLCEHNLASCFEEGLEVFDFLGDRAAWKEEWTQEATPHYWLFVLPRSPALSLVHAVKFSLLPRLNRHPLYRRLRDALAGRGADPS